MRLLLQSTIYRGPSTIPFKVVLYKRTYAPPAGQTEYIVWYQQVNDERPNDIGPRYEGSYCQKADDALATFSGRVTMHNLDIEPIVKL